MGAGEEVSQVLESFDFGQVAGLMRQMGWKWYIGGGVKQVPNEGQLREQASRLLSLVGDVPDAAMSCGGLEARRRSGRLCLRFVAVESRPSRHPAMPATVQA